ncbi:tyrosine-protein phosphatase [Listeria booriae]|uniref:Tyrosine-protein phosphatase n=1 Tax=Listeria booriae TaxID=1552123 RepID=A0A842BHK5_9LIST|nr:tyrosine-protein phosphatase [Listeria booriae]MBC1315680.1 tyrosine-protein phosphatase [Listeria booriae]MBC1905344.1 tyrosine-protein phosphatase [Listeria booriae]MBC1911065.1 tyrosine-protein phosphatase [Listeria booriae]MBC2056955.1 tyrosine-protein phosphatase [Listeria booriae]MBC2389621.1 tyrosine-protein phosphatase [Listeria booriae]
MIQTNRHGNQLTLTWSPTDILAGTIIFQSNTATPTSSKKQLLVVDQETKLVLVTEDTPVFFIIQHPDGTHTVIGERTIPLEGCFNFRDLGGYVNTAGKTVKWGKLYRSSLLTNITEKDKDTLEKLGVSWICDLRSTSEIAAKPTPALAHIKNRHIPIGTAKNESTESQKIDIPDDHRVYEPLMGESYRVFVQSKDGFREIFNDIIEKEEVPFLFHCTAGKDRTGVLGALLLKLLDIPENTILADYELTNQYADNILGEMQGLVNAFSNSEKKIDLENFRPMAEARPAYLEIAFDEMQKEYGSVDAYLEKGIGITPSEKAKFQTMMLEG